MSMPDDLPLQTGDVLKGKYRVVRVIGAGGMGAVLEAHHLVLNQRVAIKLVLPDAAKRDGSVQRFLREARAASSLRSEHVARVLDVDTLDGGLPYLVMDLLEGADLSARLRADGRLPIEETCEIGVQICEALSEAHARGIVHRDIKPGNLFVTRRADGSPLVKVLDFGIAKHLEPAEAMGAESLTSQNALVGSPLYMSPEQMRSSRGVDTRSDLWSLGVALYQALSGKLPFEAETFGELILCVMQERPAPLSSLRGELPEALSRAVMRCLERNPDDRWQDVAALAAALAPFAPARCRPLVDRARATLAASERGSRPALPDGEPPAVDLAPAAGAPFGSATTLPAASALPVSSTLPASPFVRAAATPPADSSQRRSAAAGPGAEDPGQPAERPGETELAAEPGMKGASAPTMTQTAEPWSDSRRPPEGRAHPRGLQRAGAASAIAGLAVAALLWARQRPAAETADTAAARPAPPPAQVAPEPIEARSGPEPVRAQPAPDPRPPLDDTATASPAPALATSTAPAPAALAPAPGPAAAPPARSAPDRAEASPPDARPAAPRPAASTSTAASASTTAAPRPATPLPGASASTAASAAGAPAGDGVPNYGGRK
ncbi:protein kinase domain-containing protein [Sorangium sp. So ce341]|uniref:serine/threonine-protein kinase n=1 Tax=Sorangium sp. So ce341 TaxID=3133302 RepID=UPI003F60F20D